MMERDGSGEITVCLSVDDGAEDSYTYIFPLLQKYGMPASFNIITDCVTGKMEMPDVGLKAMSREQLAEMAQSPLIEIACHGAEHTNETEGIRRGRRELLNMLGMPENTRIGFASPESRLDCRSVSAQQKEWEKTGFAYVRTGPRLRTLKLLRKAARRLSQGFHPGWLYVFAYNDTLMEETERFALSAVPVMHETTVSQVKALIRHAEKAEKNVILMLHRVKETEEEMYGDPWTWDLGKMEELMQFLAEDQKAGKLRVKTVKELAEE